MIFFKNDYSEGALPEILEALQQTNLESTVGYGLDPYCAAAADKLRARFSCPGADIHFLTGGTQTNFTCISAFLRPWEAVIAPATAHIATHETGAVEARGHKVCTAPSDDGKLRPEQIRAIYAENQTWNVEHMVDPKLVYISNPTELGTLYTKAELQDLRQVCDELGLLLYLDGARLAAALTSRENDTSPEDYPALCDAFYVGGTKNGLLFGEALLIQNDALKPCFRHMIKQCGGMLAKGRLFGVQFGIWLEDDLWLRAARHANEMAERLTAGIAEKGYDFLAHSPTNQLFPIFPDELVEALARDFAFEYQAVLGDGRTAIRLVTSWATRLEAVDTFLSALPVREERRAK